MPEAVVGRDRELEAAAEFFDRLEHGPAALVFAGEPGIGKTTLWRAAVCVGEERDYYVLTARPAQPDQSLSFAGLADLFVEIAPERFTQLPPPQRVALDAALLRGDGEGSAPDPRAVFTAALSVVTALSMERPVLLAVDDVQWLDPPSLRALQFVARRRGAQRIGLLVSSRGAEGGSLDVLDVLVSGLDSAWTNQIDIGPLTLAVTHQMLKQRLHRVFPRPTLLRIHQASGGNPFFALEIASALGTAELRPDEPLPVPSDVRTLVRRRIERLPKATRRALLCAAALSQPTASLLGSALESARKTGLVQELSDGGIAFTHPLYASAVYESAAPDERRNIHRELANRVEDVEERARHLALAATSPDEQLAAELDRAAARARSRGAPEIAAELEEQAVELTPAGDPLVSGRRALLAAEHYFHAGALARARSLLTATLAGLDDRAMRVRALSLLAHVRLYEESIPEAIELLRRAAAEAGEEPELRTPVELDLVQALIFLSFDFDSARPQAEALLRYAEHVADRTLLAEALAVGTLITFLLGGGVDEPRLARALALEDLDHHVHIQFSPTVVAGILALYVGDFVPARSLLYPVRARLRERGEEGDLPFLLGHMTWLECSAGDLAAARSLSAEALEAATLTESETMTAWSLAFAAFAEAHAGRVESCRERIDAAQQAIEHSGFGLGAMWTSVALGHLELSLGDVGAAHAAFEPLIEYIELNGVVEPIRAFFLPDAVEALVALGRVERAERLTEMLADRGRELDRPWALATSGRCRALLLAARGDLDGAGAAVERALVEHERLPMPLELGRTLLVRGQIERRARRKLEAKRSLEQALSVFEELGAELWAQKARTELARVGLKRSAPDELTASERRVAELAATGLTNKEVAAKLFVSPKTVEATLARAYRKLDISSRAELGARLAGTKETAAKV